MMSYKKKMIWNYNDGKLRSLIYWKIFVYIWYTYNIRWWSKLKYKICIKNTITFCGKVYVELKKDKKVINRYFDFVFDLWTNFTADERLKKEIKKKGVVIYEQ